MMVMVVALMVEVIPLMTVMRVILICHNDADDGYI